MTSVSFSNSFILSHGFKQNGKTIPIEDDGTEETGGDDYKQAEPPSPGNLLDFGESPAKPSEKAPAAAPAPAPSANLVRTNFIQSALLPIDIPLTLIFPLWCVAKRRGG